MDLYGIEKAINAVAVEISNLSSLDKQIDKNFKHQEILTQQEMNTAELISHQNRYNMAILREQRKLVLWTKVLAIATIILALGSVILNLVV